MRSLGIGMRVALRLLAIAVVTGATGGAQLATRPVAWLRPRLGDRLGAAWVTLWARLLRQILGMRITVSGPIPRGPCLLVCNHLSYVDIIGLLAVLPVRFLAKREVAHWPLIGPLARSVGTLFIDRTRRLDVARAIDEMRGVLTRRQPVVVFPEGTSSDGTAVLPFKPSLFAVAIDAAVPVRCAAIAYATPDSCQPAPAVCWWGDMELLPHLLALLAIPSFRMAIRFAADPLHAQDRKLLARAAHQTVTTLARGGTDSPQAPPAPDRPGAADPPNDPSLIVAPTRSSCPPSGRC